MLIICNGAFKSGSSWLHAILIELANIKNLDLQNVPIKYTNDVNSPTTIIESKLQLFLKNENYHNLNYITKSHYFKKSTLRIDYKVDVKIFFIKRDIKDAIVSHYFHILNKFSFKLSFYVYYYLLGRYKAYEISIFNKRCLKYMGDDNFFLFEDLITDFDSTIKKISKLIGIIEISEKEINIIKDKTNIKSLREKLKDGYINYYPTKRSDNWKLFRNGKIGEWKDYFTNFMLKDIIKIENDRFSFFSRFIYLFMFTLRRLIFRVE